MKCYVCQDELIQLNQSFEHIIINAAGGRLRSKDLICKKCNNEFGEDIDSALAKQLNHMANMLMIERHHGEPQPILSKGVSSGEEYKLQVGGTPSFTKPIFSKSKEGDITRITIRARSEDELRGMIEGIARKNPKFDAADAMKHAKWITKKLQEPVSVSVEVGGEIVFRAICKCAINYFIYKGGSPAFITHLIPFIKGDLKTDVVWMHYKNGLYDLQDDESFHVLKIIGDPEQRVLYCYVDYFNAYKFLVLLSDNYNGLPLESSYCFDVIQAKEITRKIELRYDRVTLIDLFKNKDTDFPSMFKAALDHGLRIGFKRQREYQRELIFNVAIQKVLGKYPAGSELNEEQLEEVLTEIVSNVLPNLLEDSPME